MEFSAKKLAFVLTPVIGLLLFWIMFINHVDINEIGVAYNMRDGKVWIQRHPGFYVTSPLVRVAYLSTLPMKVAIPSDARVINTKIVRFNPKGVDEYIRMQGFKYGMDSEQENILMGYAFSNQRPPFLVIMQEPELETVDMTPLNEPHPARLKKQ